MAAVAYDGGVALAADSLVHYHEQLAMDTGTPKIKMITDELAMGVAGKLAVRDLIWCTDIPERDDFHTDVDFLSAFAAQCRAALSDLSMLGRTDEGVRYMPGSTECVLAYRGAIYYMSQDFCVVSHTSPYMAIGSGEQYALGALYGLLGTHSANGKEHADSLVTVAVEAARRFCPTVDGDIYTLHVPTLVGVGDLND